MPNCTCNNTHVHNNKTIVRLAYSDLFSKQKMLQKRQKSEFQKFINFEECTFQNLGEFTNYKRYACMFALTTMQ